MAATSNPQAAAEQARKNYRDTTTQLGQLGLDTAVPETVRAIAEKSMAQTREFYDRSKDALDASIATFEKTFGCRPRSHRVQPQGHRYRPVECEFGLRPGQELGRR